MIKPRTVASLIRRVLEADSDARIVYESYPEIGASEDSYPQLCVWFKSAIARTELKDEIDLPIITDGVVPFVQQITKTKRFFIVWNCNTLTKPINRRDEIDFTISADEALRRRKAVTRQEEDAADLIGGYRHYGSGAVEKRKSDASSDKWQLEAKQTEHQSFSLTVKILDKITREARFQDKEPIVHIRFTNMDEGMVAPDDWVVIPAHVFARIAGL